MKVGSNNVTKSTTKLFATELTVHCIARGSNPAAEMALYLDNQQPESESRGYAGHARRVPGCSCSQIQVRGDVNMRNVVSV